MLDALIRWLYSQTLRLLTPVYLARLWWKGRKEPVYRKRIGERLAHCTIYEARPAAERQAHDGDRAVEAFRDFCEAQRRSANK